MTSLLAVVLSIARISLGHSFAVVPQRKAVATGSMVLFDSAVEEGKNTEPDLFDYFDPLMSPHAYPNGVSPNHKPVDPKKETKETMKGPDPVKMPPVTESFLSEPFETSSEEPISLSNVRFDNMAKSPYQKGAVVDPDYFDPTLSPHSYPNGAPNRMVGEGESTPKQERVVGVLLMDHGSRNQPSNDRLQELAKIYEQSVGGPIVVRAAHMEIAKPSIPDGLQTLIDEGVGKKMGELTDMRACIYSPI